MLLSRFKLPIILATVLGIMLALHQFIDSSRQRTIATAKVEIVQKQIAVVGQAEVKRGLQIVADNKNVATKLESENKIISKFNAYHEKVTDNANVSTKKKLNASDPNAVPVCGLNDDNFRVLLSAFDSTFKRADVPADTGGKLAPASGDSEAANRWKQSGIAKAKLGFNGAHTDYRKQFSEPGDGGEGTAGVAES